MADRIRTRDIVKIGVIALATGSLKTGLEMAEILPKTAAANIVLAIFLFILAIKEF